ncbi:hypothetical protein H1235_06355 [Pseudoxanthomonas sp. NC8]|nr:hypothetical protein H1235_06355 [Pseudoxanthomonas sp. NC8]
MQDGIGAPLRGIRDNRREHMAPDQQTLARFERSTTAPDRSRAAPAAC